MFSYENNVINLDFGWLSYPSKAVKTICQRIVLHKIKGTWKQDSGVIGIPQKFGLNSIKDQKSPEIHEKMFYKQDKNAENYG